MTTKEEIEGAIASCVFPRQPDMGGGHLAGLKPGEKRRVRDAATAVQALFASYEPEAAGGVDDKALREVLKDVLARDAEWASNPGDCNCINLSRDGEREYETGTCPHQRARVMLAAARGEGDKEHKSQDRLEDMGGSD